MIPRGSWQVPGGCRGHRRYVITVAADGQMRVTIVWVVRRSRSGLVTPLAIRLPPVLEPGD